MFYGFARKIWRCGAVVSIVSVLLSIAGIFYFSSLFRSRFGMHGLPDTRMSMREIWDWQLYVFHAGWEICLVGAIFAVVGAALSLMYGLGLRSTASKSRK